MKDPIVSIIVPCYNQAQFLDEALQSVLDQTNVFWECIIINDGSTDNTHDISKKWILNDKRFYYIKIKNGGVSNARNVGINKSKGKFILPLDADDKISTDYVELAIEQFNKDASLELVYCNAMRIGEEVGSLGFEPFSLSNLSKENMIFNSSFFKKESWKKIGGYDVEMKSGLEDWEFWISLLKNGGKVKKIDEIGFYYRISRNSRNKSITGKNYNTLYDYLSLKHTEFFVKYLGSFNSLNQKNLKTKKNYERKLKSEKFVLDVFFKKFFGFTIFGKYKNET